MPHILVFRGIVDFWEDEEGSTEKETETNRRNGSPLAPPKPKKDAAKAMVVKKPAPDEL